MSAPRKILVIGGTGLIGSKLIKLLRDLGHDAIPASPSKGVNSVTGEGLQAMAGVEIVVDVSNSPSFEAKAVLDFFEKSTGNLTRAAIKHGVKHFVVLSIVNTDGLPDCPYFVAKLAQESILTASKVPYTIVRATQFFEFVKFIGTNVPVTDTIKLSPVNMQPIVSDDVAAALVPVVLGSPANGIVELAGPEVIKQDELVRQYFAVIGDKHRVVADPSVGYFGAKVDNKSLVPLNPSNPNLVLGKTRYAAWLQMQRK